jgi:CheY-like chemotaxis protein
MAVIVLSVGKNPLLLRTRKEILTRLGCSVTTVMDNAEFVDQFFGGDFDLIVLCHTVPLEERQNILRLVKKHRPSMPAVVVSNYSDDNVMVKPDPSGITVAPEPDGLVRVVQGIFTQPNQSARLA